MLTKLIDNLRRTLDQLDSTQRHRWFASQTDADAARPTLEHNARFYKGQVSEVVAADDGKEMVSVPRWVLDVLAEELAGHTTCGGENDEPGCPRCDAIRIAKDVSAGKHSLPV